MHHEYLEMKEFGTIEETVAVCDVMTMTYNDELPGMAIVGITLTMKFKATASEEPSRSSLRQKWGVAHEKSGFGFAALRVN